MTEAAFGLAATVTLPLAPPPTFTEATRAPAGAAARLGAEAGILMPEERTEPATAETAATPTRGMPARTSMKALPEEATMPASAASAAAATP